MYEERTNVDEEGMRHFKERHIDRIKKQVIEEKLQEQKDWYSVPSSTYIYVCDCVSKNVMETLKSWRKNLRIWSLNQKCYKMQA